MKPSSLMYVLHNLHGQLALLIKVNSKGIFQFLRVQFNVWTIGTPD